MHVLSLRSTWHPKKDAALRPRTRACARATVAKIVTEIDEFYGALPEKPVGLQETCGYIYFCFLCGARKETVSGKCRKLKTGGRQPDDLFSAAGKK